MTRLPQHDAHGRVCNGPCAQYKPWTDFPRDVRGFGGHYSRCRACKSLIDAAHLAKDPGRLARDRRRRILAAMVPTILDLVARDATTHGTPLTAADLCGNGRTPEVDAARRLAYYLLKRHLALSLSEIGVQIPDPLRGPRDRSTISHGLKNLRRILTVDPEYAARLRALDRLCTQARRTHPALPPALRARERELRGEPDARLLPGEPHVTEEAPPPPAIPTDPVALYWHLQAHRRRPGAPLYAVG